MLDTDYPYFSAHEPEKTPDEPAPDFLALLAAKCPHSVAALVISHLSIGAMHSGAPSVRFESRKGWRRLFNLK